MTVALRPSPPAAIAPGSPTERAVVFGPGTGLVGVLTAPPPPAAPRVGPRRALLVANIGLHHHVGPFRLYVELTRAAAARGWHALRFDFAGLGDSAPRAGALTSGADGDVAQAVDDTRAAMDWLAAEQGIEEFVLVALCSGVDSAHAVTLDDPRVVGAAFIDGYAYPTAGFRLRRHVVRYLQAGRWARWLRRRLDRRALATAVVSEADEGAATGSFTRSHPTRGRFRADVAAMVARGARLLFVYTGAVDGSCNDERQLGETLGPAVPMAAIEVALVRDADHVFTGVEARGALVRRVLAWMDRLPP